MTNNKTNLCVCGHHADRHTNPGGCVDCHDYSCLTFSPERPAAPEDNLPKGNCPRCDKPWIIHDCQVPNERPAAPGDWTDLNRILDKLPNKKLMLDGFRLLLGELSAEDLIAHVSAMLDWVEEASRREGYEAGKDDGWVEHEKEWKNELEAECRLCVQEERNRIKEIIEKFKIMVERDDLEGIADIYRSFWNEVKAKLAKLIEPKT